MPDAVFMTPDALLAHWQAHRRLTRRVIDAFPEDQLFTFAVGGMRPFGAMAMEFLGMTIPMVQGSVTGEWQSYQGAALTTKADVLKRWDEDTAQLDALWPKIPAAHFADTITAFGQYTGTLYDLLMYIIDNEIHHRGQGYVYLRALGIEPPPFYDRS
ncbi:MAG: DinB family protein [Gemmatimonadaceae bacterium]